MKLCKLVTIIVLTALTFGCQGNTQDPSNHNPSKTLQVYSVPSTVDNITELESTIRRLLTLRNESDADDLGTVVATGQGQLLVVAPDEFQKGVKDLIDSLKNNSLPTDPVATNYRQEYWAFIGTNHVQMNDSNIPAELSPVLETIKKESGDTSFVLLEKLATLSTSDEPMKLEGKDMEGKGRVANHRGTLTLFTQLNTLNNRIESRVNLKSGEFVVLAQSNVRKITQQQIAALFGTAVPEDKLRLYIVVRAKEMK